MPEDQAPKLPETSVEIVYPTSQEKKSPLIEFAPEIRELLRNDPEATKRVLFTVLDGMKTDQEIRRDFQKQEFELKNKETEQGHTITKMRETRIDSETKAKKNTNRLIMGAITFAFAGSLGYGFLHKDTSLADKIFTGAMGILGGAGGLVLSQKKDKE
jgi:hypothetical protein